MSETAKLNRRETHLHAGRHPLLSVLGAEHRLADCGAGGGGQALAHDVRLVGLLVSKLGVQQLVQVARLNLWVWV